VRVIVSLKHLGLPKHNPIAIDPAVLGFTFGLAVLTGLIFGIVPALQISRPDLYDELKGGAGGTNSAGKRRRSASDTLVVAEMGLSLLLLLSAALLLKDFMRLRSNNIGVRPEGVWTAAISLPEATYAGEAQVFNFGKALLDKLQQLAGAESAALSNRMPLEGGSNGYITLRGQPSESMTGPLVESFALDERVVDFYKSGNQPPTELTNAMVYPVVINQTMAHYFWKDQNPVGKVFSHGDKNGPWREVIGVVGDVKQWGLTHPPQPEAYDVFDGSRGFFIVVHSSSPSLDLTSAVRNAVVQLDPTLPLYSIRTMHDVIALNASGQEFLAMLLGLFSGLALLLAAVGIYGVLSYLVTQRTREIGIRMSLGASRSHVLSLVLKHGMRLAALGFAAGLVAAVIAGRLLAGLLHEVHATDPGIAIASAVSLTVIALVACYLPARRAARVDPIVALRCE